METKKKIIAVVDGLGGGIGSHIIEKLKGSLSEEIEIIALGTNSIATSNMMKAGAHRGATGENAIVQTVGIADVIVGSLGIVLAHAMLGEITPKIAEAVTKSASEKVLIPMTHCRVEICGVGDQPIGQLIDFLVERVKNLLER